MSDEAKFTGKLYTCKPIQKLKLGRFSFIDGLLRLTDDEEIEEMAANLAALADSNPAFRHKIRTISVGAAEAVIAAKPREAVSGAMSSADAIPTVQESLALEAAAEAARTAGTSEETSEDSTPETTAPKPALKLG